MLMYADKHSFARSNQIILRCRVRLILGQTMNAKLIPADVAQFVVTSNRHHVRNQHAVPSEGWYARVHPYALKANVQPSYAQLEEHVMPMRLQRPLRAEHLNWD